MASIFFLWLISFFGCALSQKNFTQQLLPIVTKINPWFGGIEGGTKITISGGNLASSTLFTETIVFIGNDRCQVIGHFSTPESLVCLTPKCSSASCLSGNIASGSTIVDVRVYVSSVEGILTPESIPKFYYYNAWTPAVFWMHSATWGTASTPLIVRSDNIDLSSFDIVFADQYHGDLGSDGELNSDRLPGNLKELELNYRPPLDLAGGFYNLSFIVQDDFSYGSFSTGRAITFERDRYDTSMFSRFYLYQATDRGTSYSICLYPSISSTSPPIGSDGGGTILTIRGSGFSSNPEELFVLAHGLPCEILTSSLTAISCKTSKRSLQNFKSISGSPGWWMRVWNHSDFSHPLPENSLLSFRWTQKFYFSFSDYYSSSWPSVLRANFPNNNRYIHDSASIFIAPYSGYYSFYIASDDYSYLYASSEGIEVNEKLLAYNPSTSNTRKYYTNPQHQISSLIPLHKGERLYLRFRNVNTGGYDFSLISLKIFPIYSCNGSLIDGNTLQSIPVHALNGSQVVSPQSCNQTIRHDENFPGQLLQHHSVREIQEVSLLFDYRRERQLLNFTGVTDGEFVIVIQGQSATDSLSLSSSSSVISNALYRAALKIDSTKRECLYFNVWIRKTSNSFELTIEFLIDNSSPLSLLEGYSLTLKGPNPSIRVTRLQEHTALPSSTFDLSFRGRSVAIPWDASANTIETLCESAFLEDYLNVYFPTHPLASLSPLPPYLYLSPSPYLQIEVTRIGSKYTGYTWSITFVHPRGDLPDLIVDPLGLEGPTVQAFALTRSNGSVTQLWFEPLPEWMVEVPLDWATLGEVSGNVEVYRRDLSSGDVVKAVCDSTGDQGTGFHGFFKGREEDCAFHYSQSVTALVTNQYLLSTTDHAEREDGEFEVVIEGVGFLLSSTHFNSSAAAAVAGEGTLRVQIGQQRCNILSLTNSTIHCSVKDVPAGLHTAIVTLQEYGEALLQTESRLLFPQIVTSISPTHGSFSGGQLLTIKGHGFPSDVVIFVGVEICSVVTSNSSMITCLTPAAVAPLGANTSLTNWTSINHLPLGNFSHSNTTAGLGLVVDVVIGELLFENYYAYEVASTPIVYSINPSDISSAVTTVIEIIGFGFSNETTIHIGTHVCVPQDISSDMILCLLTRSAATAAGQSHSPLTMTTLSVFVYVPNYGYAGEESSMTSLPVVNYGFEVTSVFPASGSIKGGSVLYIDGFGFSDIGINSQSVSLTSVVNPPDEYSSLLLELGLVGPSTSPDPLVCHTAMPTPLIIPSQTESHVHSVQMTSTPETAHMHTDSTASTSATNTSHFTLKGIKFCEILDLSFTRIVCLLPRSLDATNEDSYIVSVKTNGISTTCQEKSCLFNETITSTPVVTSTKLLEMDRETGEISILVTTVGNLFLSYPTIPIPIPTAAVNVSIEYIDCHVTHIEMILTDVTEITAKCPCVHAGDYRVHVHVRDYGCADVPVERGIISVPLQILSVVPETSLGSFAGGTIFELLGHGFCPECRNNSIQFHHLNGYFQVSESDFIDCSVHRIRFYAPSALPLSSLSIENIEIESISLTFRSLSTNSSLFNFHYSFAGTPVLFSASPLSGYEKTNLTLTLDLQLIADNHSSSTFLHTADTPNTAIRIGDLPCLSLSINSLTATKLQYLCSVPPLRGSTSHPITISLSPHGYAMTMTASGTIPQFYSEFAVNSLSPPTVLGSVGGGKFLTLTGKGLSGETQILICEQNCTVINATYDSVTCSTPRLLTKTVVDVVSLEGNHLEEYQQLELLGTLYSSRGLTSSQMSRAVDGSYQTYFSHNSLGCYLGIVLPNNYLAKPYRFRYYPRLQYASSLTDSVFEASQDGGISYTVLSSFDKSHEGWNFVEVNQTLRSRNRNENQNENGWFSHFRIRSVNPTKSSQCMIAEMKVIGVLALKEETCAITVTPQFDSQLAAPITVGHLKLDLSVTPFVKSLTPMQGTSLGGTNVTIHGWNLIPTDGDYVVSSMRPMIHLNGMCCMVTGASSTEVNCTTMERSIDQISGGTGTGIKMFVDGMGDALVDTTVRYLYIDNWSSLTTWRDQEPPVQGDFVWIPEGQVVMLDINPPQLSVLLVEGQLYFDQSQDLNLSAEYIIVNGGRFQIGTTEEPYLRKATVTLHGDRYSSIELPHIGSKALVVGSKGMHHATGEIYSASAGIGMGALEIHGAKRLRTWTKIAKTALAGSNFIITSEDVDFKEGEQVVITGSERPQDGSFQEEVVTVLSNEGMRRISFTPSLQFTHRSEIRVIHGRVVDLRVEVGLLSRNIIVQGDENSDKQLYGAHTLGMSGIIFRIENAEFRRCGQAFNIGRYCTHAHHGGNFEGNYVRGNSIHHSYQRAVTTHATSYWEVRDNVAYEIMGHAYFVEDGDEFYNTYSGNLGIKVKTSSALLKSDTKPAVFWTTNPNNFWYDNVGVHSHSFGFWFELPSNPPNSLSICSSNEHLGEFQNNTFRANGVLGLRIYPIWIPLEIPCNSSSPPAPQYLRNMLSYRNGGNGMFGKRHGDLHHIGHTFLENGGHDVSIVHYFSPYSPDPTFLDTLFVATLDPLFDERRDWGKFALWAPQDEYFFVKNSTFVNYGTGGALSGCNSCDSDEEMHQDGLTYRFEQLTFLSTPRRVTWSKHFKQIFWDLDGSLTGHMNSYLLKWYDFNSWPSSSSPSSSSPSSSSCLRVPEPSFDDSMVCINTTVRRLEVDYVKPNQVDFTDLVLMSSVGVDEIYFLPKNLYGWVIPIVSSHAYRLDWTDSALSPSSLHLNLGDSAYLKENLKNGFNETVIIEIAPHRYDYIPYSYLVTTLSDDKTVTTVSSNLNKSISILNATMGQSSFVNGTLRVALSTRQAKLEEREPFAVSIAATLCPPAGCPLPPYPSIPNNYSLWSSFASWPNGKVPSSGQDVVIEADMWIQLDISPPALRSLIVYGKLTFQQHLPSLLTLRVGSLLVYGTVEICGRNHSSFQGKAEIVLTGTKLSSIPHVVGEGRFLGSKVLAVMGEFVMIGESMSHSWLRLSSSVKSGSSSLILNVSHLSWRIGSEIAISPTAYFQSSSSSWQTYPSSLEIRSITNLQQTTDGQTILTLNQPLLHSHSCRSLEKIWFCGAVGLLTRNLKISSQDSEDPLDVTNFGFGGHVIALDLSEVRYSASRVFSGTLVMKDIEMRNLGKVNSNHYGVSLDYLSSSNSPSFITNCSIHGNYNLAIRSSKVVNLTISGNVLMNNFGGGIFVENESSHYQILQNLILGTFQLSSVLKSSYPWTRPVAGITIQRQGQRQGDGQGEDWGGIVKGNLVAGSVDQGYAVSTHFFTHLNPSVCLPTKGKYFFPPSPWPSLHSTSPFSENEAVGCKVGLAIVNDSPLESEFSDCVLVTGITSWRNAHVGLMAIAAKANLLVSHVTVAENHIGILTDYVRATSSVAFSGIISSTIIGSLSSTSDETNWNHLCHTFTDTDPLAVGNICSSTVSSFYSRVGVIISQFTNRGKTCGVDNSWDQCQPPNTPERLCALPWDLRYGLPASLQYPEMHLHNSMFYGFNQTADKSRSVAIVLNPSQIDQQPTVLISNVHWKEVNQQSRFGFESLKNQCNSRTCMGLEATLIHDLDGTASGIATGQLLYGNPNYASPSPQCVSASELSSGLTFCPEIVNGVPQPKRYAALWRDYQSFLIGPLKVTTHYRTENRTYATYSPIDDLCAHRFSFSQFPFFLLTGHSHRIESTGTIPSTWFLRWDSPSNEDATLVEFFIPGSNDVRVFISSSETGPFIEIPSLTGDDRFPTLDDAAGTNRRNPQKRTCTVTLRGGQFHFYKFVLVPTIQVNMKIEMTLEEFVSDFFVANIAMLLGISANRIKIVEVRRGSVIVDFVIDPLGGRTRYGNITTMFGTDEDVANEVIELATLSDSVHNMTTSSILSETLGVPILSTNLTRPVYVPNNIEFVTTNFPTNSPTRSPTRTPSCSPTTSPSSFSPSLSPTAPSPLPTLSPTAVPSSAEPTLLPSVDPTLFPSIHPTLFPSVEPTLFPSLPPTLYPSLDPTFHPSTEPSWAPSLQPTLSSEPSQIPSQSPSHAPTLIPTGSPSLAPTPSPSLPFIPLRTYRCRPGSRKACFHRGSCNEDGNLCECDDSSHYWPSERCQWWHEGRELQDDWLCFPQTVDSYCSWLGICDGSGSSCLCHDFPNRTSADHCATWSPVPNPSPPVSNSSNCFPGDRSICHNNGACDSTGERCSCDDVLHYWSSDHCLVRHEGPELTETQCCKPLEVDFYCSWLGRCSADGQSCTCFDSYHRLPSERCQFYHVSLTSFNSSASVSDGNTCPPLFSIPADALSSNGPSEDSVPSERSLAFSFYVLGFLFLTLLAIMKLWDSYELRAITNQSSDSKASTLTVIELIEVACALSGIGIFPLLKTIIPRKLWFLSPFTSSSPSSSRSHLILFLISSTQVLIIAYCAMLVCVLYLPLPLRYNDYQICGQSLSSSDCLAPNSLVSAYCHWDSQTRTCSITSPHLAASQYLAWALVVMLLSLLPVQCLRYLLLEYCGATPSLSWSEEPLMEPETQTMASIAEEATTLVQSFPNLSYHDLLHRLTIAQKSASALIRRSHLGRLSDPSLFFIREFLSDQLPPVPAFLFKSSSWDHGSHCGAGKLFIGHWLISWSSAIAVWIFCGGSVISWIHEATTTTMWLQLWLILFSTALLCWTVGHCLWILIWDVLLVRHTLPPRLSSLRSALLLAYQRMSSPNLSSPKGSKLNLCQHTSHVCRAARSSIFDGSKGAMLLRAVTDGDLASASTSGAHRTSLDLHELLEGEKKNEKSDLLTSHRGDAVFLGYSEDVHQEEEDLDRYVDFAITVRDEEPSLRRLSSDAMSAEDVRLPSEMFNI